jgi:hypothetical protein
MGRKVSAASSDVSNASTKIVFLSSCSSPHEGSLT